MKNSTLLLAIASAMLLQAAPAVAQNNVPIRKIKAVKPTTELTLLDRVESDTHKKIYQYNEYGYITSVMEYRKEAGQWCSTPTTRIARSTCSMPPDSVQPEHASM